MESIEDLFRFIFGLMAATRTLKFGSRGRAKRHRSTRTKYDASTWAERYGSTVHMDISLEPDPVKIRGASWSACDSDLLTTVLAEYVHLTLLLSQGT